VGPRGSSSRNRGLPLGLDKGPERFFELASVVVGSESAAPQLASQQHQLENSVSHLQTKSNNRQSQGTKEDDEEEPCTQQRTQYY
jgi:hypothetical protein